MLEVGAGFGAAALKAGVLLLFPEVEANGEDVLVLPNPVDPVPADANGDADEVLVNELGALPNEVFPALVPFPPVDPPVPKAGLPVPKAELPDPKAEFPVPKAELPDPNAEFPVPKAELPDPKAELPVPKAELPEPNPLPPKADPPPNALISANYGSGREGRLSLAGGCGG